MRVLVHVFVLLLVAAAQAVAQPASIVDNPGAPILSAEKQQQARELQQAKMAGDRARATMNDVLRRLAGSVSQQAQDFRSLSQMNLQQGEQALRQGDGATALRLFRAAESFLKRMSQTLPGSSTDPCAAARANLSRVREQGRRAESAVAPLGITVANELIARAFRLLEESARQEEANQCKESLRTSRLAENLLKRAAEKALEARR